MDINELYDIFEIATGVTTDSRKVENGNLFFALHGDNFDGNLFAINALESGACYAVVDSDVAVTDKPHLTERLIRVDDTLAALQQLAAEHRNRLAIPIIGIVGSNGKTTTKELIASVLADKYEIYATRGNLNNHIGVPLTLLAMTRDTEFGIVEMGASAQGEIALLCSIAQPNYGLITNIGNAHLEGFKGPEGIKRGKGELFDYLQQSGGRAFVPQEDSVLKQMAEQRDNMAIEFYSRTIANSYKSNLEGDYNRYNIAAAVAVGSYFGIDSERLAIAIENYTPTNNRSQRVVTQQGNNLIIDCYNANPSSMAAALENMAVVESDKKVLILGDMLELGEWSQEEHCKILQMAMQIEGAEILLVGSHFAAAAEFLEAGTKLFPTTAEVSDYLLTHKYTATTILLKGSRGIALEKLINLL